MNGLEINFDKIRVSDDSSRYDDNIEIADVRQIKGTNSNI